MMSPPTTPVRSTVTTTTNDVAEVKTAVSLLGTKIDKLVEVLAANATRESTTTVVNTAPVGGTPVNPPVGTPTPGLCAHAFSLSKKRQNKCH